MIPTFLVILIINFGILRFQDLPLSAELGGGGQGDEGTLDAEKQNSSLRNYLGRLRRTGNNLPALINLDVFDDKDSMIERLEALKVTDKLNDSDRFQREVNLMVSGYLLVEPLAAVLADDSCRHLHGIASRSFVLCAYTPPLIEDGYTSEELSIIRKRNLALEDLSIDYTNTSESGFRVTDPDYESKRAKLLQWYEGHKELYARSVIPAIFSETGFTVFMSKLFTGTLWSETKKRYVFEVIGEKWQKTLLLNILSVIIAWGIAVPLGIRSARRINTLEDKVTTNVLFFLWSMPSFFAGALLLHHFCTDSATGNAIFPHRGLESSDSMWMGIFEYLGDLFMHGFLPLLVLTYASFTVLSRYMRANLLEQLNADYVRTARAKGASEDAIVYKHSMRNSMVTMVTLGAGLLSELFGGFVIVETIFTIDGLGLLMLDAVLQQDAPLVMGTTVITVGLMLIGFLIADILYAVVDPRIRSQYG